MVNTSIAISNRFWIVFVNWARGSAFASKGNYSPPSGTAQVSMGTICRINRLVMIGLLAYPHCHWGEGLFANFSAGYHLIMGQLNENWALIFGFVLFLFWQILVIASWPFYTGEHCHAKSPICIEAVSRMYISQQDVYCIEKFAQLYQAVNIHVGYDNKLNLTKTCCKT